MRVKVRTRGYIFWVKYTLLFAVAALIYFWPFIQNGRSLVWYSDGVYQHYTAYVYWGQYLRNVIRSVLSGHPAIPMWDFSLGLGADVISSLSYYIIGDPLGLLTVFVPSRHMEIFYCLMIVVRLYLAGVAFAVFCRQHKCAQTGTLAGALVYIFATYTLANTCKHPFFANPMIYLPLLLTGVERIYKERKPALFMIMTAVSAFSNYYFFYMLVIEVIIYTFVRYFSFVRENRLRQFFPYVLKFALYGLAGTLAAGIIFIPSAYALLHSERVDVSAEITVPFLYPLIYYVKLWLGFISNMTIGSYSITRGTYTYMGFGSFCVPAVGILLGTRKKHRDLKWIFAISTVMLMLPVVGQIMNGMSYSANRWAFSYNLLIAFVLAIIWPRLLDPSKKDVIVSFMATAVYLGISMFFRKWMTGGWMPSAWVLVLSQAFIVAVFLLRRYPRLKRIADTPALLLVFTGAVMIGFLRFQPDGDYLKEFVPSGRVLEQSIGVPAAEAASLDDGTFFRFGTSSNWNTGGNEGASDKRVSLNGASVVGAHGVSYFYSIMNPNIEKFVQMEMGTETYTSAYSVSFGRREGLLDFCGVRYYIVPEEYTETVPGNFKLKTVLYKKGTKWEVWENPYALPFGVMYENIISEEEFSDMEPADCEQNLMKNAAVPEGSTSLPRGRVSEPRELPWKISEASGVTCTDGCFKAEAGGSVHLTFNGRADKETLLQFTGFTFSPERSPGNEQWVEPFSYAGVSVAADGGLPEVQTVSTPDYIWHAKKSNYVWAMQSKEKQVNGLTITFNIPGTYRYESMKVASLDTEQFTEDAKKLQQSAMRDTRFQSNRVYGTTGNSENAALCVSIPYSSGWTAFVDGKKTKTFPVNTIFTGIELTAGHHEVELRYRTPGIITGSICSVTGICLMVFLGRNKTNGKHTLRRQRRKKGADNAGADINSGSLL